MVESSAPFSINIHSRLSGKSSPRADPDPKLNRFANGMGG
jgi:hypothetical protein